jgi:MFS family permease
MKLFYGWIIVAAGFAISCVGFGTMMSLGVFLQPMASEMGWSRASISTAATLNFICMGAGSFMWGALSDRFGTRTVLLGGGSLLGLGLIASGQATTALQFQLLFGGLVGLGTGSFYAPLMSITTRWFTHHRSLAVALVSAGMSLGSTTVAPLARWLISTYDWRIALAVLGGLAWTVIIPTASLVREVPGSSAHRAAGGDSADGMTVSWALRTPQFAAIALTHFACCAAHSGPIFHMVSYAIDCGVSAMTAATIIGTAGLSSLCGRIACGLIADRVGAKQTLIAGLLIQATAIALYIFVGNLTSFYLIAAMFGLAYGGVMPLYAILVREYFGSRIMGTVFGAVAMASTLGMALGPVAGGWLFDAWGSYFWLYVGSAGIGLGAVAIAVLFHPPSMFRIASPDPALPQVALR